MCWAFVVPAVDQVDTVCPRGDATGLLVILVAVSATITKHRIRLACIGRLEY